MSPIDSILNRVSSLTSKQFRNIPGTLEEAVSTGAKVFQSQLTKPFLAEQALIEEHNPYKHVTAKVRQGRSLCRDEEAFVKQREGNKTRKAIGDLLGRSLHDVSDEQLPRIGMAFSGGSFRSMVATASTLQAAEEVGLLDAVTYVTGVSGGAWALGQIYGPHNGNLNTATTTLRQMMLSDPNYMYNSEMIKLYLHMSLERLVNDEEYSALEAYSSALSHRMLSETAPHKQYLSNQKALLEEGALPAPIYNAVFSAQQSGVGMKWLELSPWECGCADIGQGVFVPTWSFGRQFNDGVSVSSFKEKPLGFLLAVLGGPFVASFRRMLDEIEHELPPELGTALSTILLKGNLNDNVVLQPAQIHNFLLGLKCLTGDDAKFAECTKVPVMDAALDFNLPVPPLWRLERGVDVAAVFDNSKAHLILDTDEKLMGRELTLAAFSANRNGHSFPKLKQKCVWDGGKHHFTDQSAYLLSEDLAEIPKSGLRNVIYCPLTQNKKLPDCDPHSEDYASLNFQYKASQYDLLADLAKTNLHDSLSTIVEGMDRSLGQKTK